MGLDSKAQEFLERTLGLKGVDTVEEARAIKIKLEGLLHNTTLSQIKSSDITKPILLVGNQEEATKTLCVNNSWTLSPI